jgi:hypothetical protein
MPIGAGTGIALERQVIRPDIGASYFWRTTTYDSFVRDRRSGDFVPDAISADSRSSA